MQLKMWSDWSDLGVSSACLGCTDTSATYDRTTELHADARCKLGWWQMTVNSCMPLYICINTKSFHCPGPSGVDLCSCAWYYSWSIMHSITYGCCVAESVAAGAASMLIVNSSLSDRIVYCLQGMETKAECACLPLTYLSLTLRKWKCWYATWDVLVDSCLQVDRPE